MSKNSECTLHALSTKVWKINSFLQLFFNFISYFFVVFLAVFQKGGAVCLPIVVSGFFGRTHRFAPTCGAFSCYCRGRPACLPAMAVVFGFSLPCCFLSKHICSLRFFVSGFIGRTHRSAPTMPYLSYRPHGGRVVEGLPEKKLNIILEIPHCVSG